MWQLAEGGRGSFFGMPVFLPPPPPSLASQAAKMRRNIWEGRWRLARVGKREEETDKKGTTTGQASSSSSSLGAVCSVNIILSVDLPGLEGFLLLSSVATDGKKFWSPLHSTSMNLPSASWFPLYTIW